MDPTQLLIVVAIAVVLVAVLIARQLADYKQQVAQLDPKKTKKPREFGVHTVEEVAKHNNRDDAWIIVQHKETKEWRVYDVTEYVDEHPGGESILAHVGTDATEGVYGPQHPITTFLLMEEYCIGKLAAGEEAAFQKSK